MIELIQTLKNPTIHAVTTASDSLEILTKLNEFYNSAWDKLILFGAVIGILVPVLLQWYQKQVLKINEREFEAKMHLKIIEIRQEIEEEINNKLEEKIEEFKIETERNYNLFSALFLQFNADKLLEKDSYYQALTDYVGAISYYVLCEDLAGISIVLENLHISITNLSEIEITKLKNDENIDLIKNLKNIDNIENSIVLREKINMITQIFS